MAVQTPRESRVPVAGLLGRLLRGQALLVQPGVDRKALAKVSGSFPPFPRVNDHPWSGLIIRWSGAR